MSPAAGTEAPAGLMSSSMMTPTSPTPTRVRTSTHSIDRGDQIVPRPENRPRHDDGSGRDTAQGQGDGERDVLAGIWCRAAHGHDVEDRLLTRRRVGADGHGRSDAPTGRDGHVRGRAVGRVRRRRYGRYREGTE